MGVGYSSLPLSTATQHNSFPLTTFPSETKSNSVPKSIFSSNPTKKDGTFNTYLHKFAFFPTTQFPICVLHARVGPLRCGRVRDMEILEEIDSKRAWDVRSIDQDLIQKLTYDALVWSSLHGLVIGDKSIRVSFKISFLDFISVHVIELCCCYTFMFLFIHCGWLENYMICR